MPSDINSWVVNEFKSEFDNVENMVFVDCSRLNSKQTYDFRKKLSDDNARLKLLRNRVFKVAVTGTEKEDAANLVKGSTAVVFGEDALAVSRQVLDLAKSNDAVAIKGGFCLGQLVSENEITRLATIPSREVLLTQLVQVLNGPISGFVNVLAGPLRGLAGVLNAIKDKQENE